MAEVAWTEEAQRWLQDIHDFIAADNPDAAAATVRGIFDRTRALADFPEMDPAGRWRVSGEQTLAISGGRLAARPTASRGQQPIAPTARRATP